MVESEPNSRGSTVATPIYFRRLIPAFANSDGTEVRMLLRTFTVAAVVVTLLSTGAVAQNAGSVVAAASKAMGVDTLNSITYSGTARNGAFGQSKEIDNPTGPNNLTPITKYTRTITFGEA